VKHLNTYKTFEGLNPLHSNNERYYTLLDILQEHLDEIGISGIPDNDDAESYLENGDSYWGFYNEHPRLQANSNNPDFDIEGLALWNLTESKFNQFQLLLNGEETRIKNALGEHIKVKRDVMDEDVVDMYISFVPEDEYYRHKFSERVESAKTKLKKIRHFVKSGIPFRSLPKEDTEKVFNLIDEIYKIVNKK